MYNFCAKLNILDNSTLTHILNLLPFQSTQLTLASSSYYEFTFDDSRNIKSISLPSRAEYKVNRVLGIGFQRVEILGFNNECLLFKDFGSEKNILHSSRPGIWILAYHICHVFIISSNIQPQDICSHCYHAV